MEDNKAFRQQLDAESRRMFPGTSRAAKLKRKAWRNEQRAAHGFRAESKLSRGGLAGVVDRNKKVIKPLVQVGAGLLGGPAAAAAAGALMGGLDTGRRGIGFDAGRAARGGLEGLAVGGATQLGVGALKGGAAALKAGQGVGAAAKAAKAGALATGTGQRLVQIGSRARTAMGNAMPGAETATAGTAAAGRPPMNWADYLQLGVTGLGAIDGMKRANAAGREADRQFGMATRANEASLALLPTIASRIGDRSGGPDLSHLDDLDNVYTRRRRAMAPSAGAPMLPAPGGR